MVQIHQERFIDVDSATVWAALSDYPNVYKWVPMVKASHQTTESPQGVGAGRSCEIPGFGELVETVDQWNEGVSFSFLWEASGPVRNGRSKWTLERQGSGTRVIVDIEAHMRYGMLGELIGHTMLKSQMGRLMADALRGLEHYVRTGEVVDGAVAKRLGLKAA